MIADTTAAIAYHETLAGAYFRLGLHTGWKLFVPGQFAMVQVPPVSGLLLRRPFSLARQIGPVTEILYKVVGKGTEALSQMKVGQELKILGPLGRGFSHIPQGKNIVGVAGGYGIAPFWELAVQLRERSQDLKLFYGARAAKDLIYLDQLREAGVELHLATEDGSQGHRGLVTEVLAQKFYKEKPDWVGACGPMGLLYAVGRWSEQKGVGAQLSVEEAMGCGTGVCLGCVVKDREGHYRRACIEGPVMSAQSMEIPA